MKELFTRNLTAKLVAVVLATLLWAVIRRSQVDEPTTSQRRSSGLEFGAGAYGK